MKGNDDSQSQSFEECFFMEDRIRDPKDFTTDYDFCLVLPVDENGTTRKDGVKIEGFTPEGVECLQHLASVGVDYLTFYGADKTTIFVLMRASVQQLRAFAEYSEFNLPLNAEKLRVLIEEGDPKNDIAPVQISHLSAESTLYPYEHIFGPYRTDIDEDIYVRSAGMSHPFSTRVRLRLTQQLIETISLAERHSHTLRENDSKTQPGTEMKNLREKLLKEPTTTTFDLFDSGSQANAMLTFGQHILRGNILAFFPLHNRQEIRAIQKKCMKISMMPWQLPTNNISSYFGEKVALYFDFMGHYSKWLCIPTVFGMPVQYMILRSGNYNSIGQIIYAAATLMWGIVMLEVWKGKEAMLGLKRGMAAHDAHEKDRPEFHGSLASSHINGGLMIYYPSLLRKKKMILSFTIIGAMVVMVIGMITAIYIVRVALAEPLGSYAQMMASIANAAQIQLLNRYYPQLADTLTEFENHRTDTDFSNSMTTKLFVFLFVNSYGSFFYIAFVAQSVGGGDDCGGATCMPALALNLAIIFGIRELSAITQEAVMPYIVWKRKLDSANNVNQRQENRHTLTRAELQFLSPVYDVMKESIGEYAEVAVQFGYIILFAAALPIAPMAGLLASFIEAKSDLFKLLHIYQRPGLRPTEHIGAWHHILEIMCTMSVVTNAGIVVFTMNTFDDGPENQRFWIFVFFQWILLGFQMLMKVISPGSKPEVAIQQARQKILVERAIYKIPDYSTDESDQKKGTLDNDHTIHEAVEREGSVTIEGLEFVSVAKVVGEEKVAPLQEDHEKHLSRPQPRRGSWHHRPSSSLSPSTPRNVSSAPSKQSPSRWVGLDRHQQAARFGSMPKPSLYAKLERSQAAQGHIDRRATLVHTKSKGKAEIAGLLHQRRSSSIILTSDSSDDDSDPPVNLSRRTSPVLAQERGHSGDSTLKPPKSGRAVDNRLAVQALMRESNDSDSSGEEVDLSSTKRGKK